MYSSLVDSVVWDFAGECHRAAHLGQMCFADPCTEHTTHPAPARLPYYTLTGIFAISFSFASSFRASLPNHPLFVFLVSASPSKRARTEYSSNGSSANGASSWVPPATHPFSPNGFLEWYILFLFSFQNFFI